MRTIFQQWRLGSSALALLLAASVLFISTAAVTPALHTLIHPDAAAHDHQCVITLFASGHVSAAPDIQILIAAVALFAGVILLIETFALPSADYRFSLGRAPPA